MLGPYLQLALICKNSTLIISVTKC